eukprot:13994403-Alexandrium_andersonii.AAC.1
MLRRAELRVPLPLTSKVRQRRVRLSVAVLLRPLLSEVSIQKREAIRLVLERRRASFQAL